MRKIFTSILVILLVFCFFPVFAIEASETVENGDFEGPSMLWSPGALSFDTAHTGSACLSFSAEGMQDGVISTSYMSPLALAKNTVYMLRFYVRTNTDGETVLLPNANISMPTHEKSIVVSVSAITTEWKKISLYFMVDASDNFHLELSCNAPSEDSVIYIDDIAITKMDFSPVQMDLQGPRTVTIPESGENIYTYTPVVTDANGNSIAVRTGKITIAESMPDGIYFDDEQGKLYVSSYAPENISLTFLCTPFEGSASLPPIRVTVFFSKNLLTNGTFEDSPSYTGWDMEDSSFSILHETQESFAHMHTERIEEGLYAGSIFPASSFVLFSSEIYVFRGLLKSSAGFETRQIQNQILSPDVDGIIHIQFADVGGTEWTEVIGAFRVPTDGIYTIQFDFFATDNRPIFIDSIQIQPETLKPSTVQFELPMHIAIPSDGTLSFPLFPIVYDQENTPCASSPVFLVSPENQGVTVESNLLLVSASAKADIYKVSVIFPDTPHLNTEKSVSISKESIGDGSFERTAPGQWWATATPSRLQYVSTYETIHPTNGNKMAKLTLNGSVSALLSDSIYAYENGKSYVFEANMQTGVSDIETIVTVLVDNAYSDSFDDNLVVGQSMLSSEMKRIQLLFTPSEAVTGRIMIAFNTPEYHDQQEILLDNISVSPARVEAKNTYISGLPYLNLNVIGKYRFYANFDAVDASSCRWLISNTQDGIFMPIEGQTDNTLSITEDMLGKYVKFEVTPASLRGPVTGEIAVSAPILVGEPIPTDTYPGESTETEITDSPEKDPDTSAQTPSSVLPPPDGGLQGVNLTSFTVTYRHQFVDLLNHWAKDDIELLTAAGIVQGRGNGLFEPDANITRAEFCTFLARAFSLAPIYYEGPFEDVKHYNWYAGAVAVVTKHGIANGTSETTFSPELPITREEMAAMIMRAYRKTNLQQITGNLPYTDATEISSWAKEDVAQLKTLGLMQGHSDGMFLPRANATRAEAAVTISRMLKLVSK